MHWHVVKMFFAAALAGQVHVVRFLVEGGAPLTVPPLADVLPDVLEQCKDDESADRVWPVVQYLVTGAGMDVNKQRRKDCFSAMHVACLRNYVRVVVKLI